MQICLQAIADKCMKTIKENREKIVFLYDF